MRKAKVDMTACRICKNRDGNTVHIASEMMLGLDGEFKYTKCTSCGCLQISEVPEDIAKYYPSDYYSYKKRDKKGFFKENALKKFFKRQRSFALSGGEGLAGRLISKVSTLPSYMEWVKYGRVGPDSEILDVGCGAGAFLLKLRKEGFTRLTGVDPYIEKDIDYGGGVRVYKRELTDMEGSFDFITFHHSFEHMAEPYSVLKEVRRLLRDNCCLLIRVPIVSSFIWQRYGVNWVQLDAPRHYFLHTVDSMRVLAKEAGFDIERIVFDSSELQLWGSEQYEQGISLVDKRSYSVDRENSIFSREDIEAFKTKAEELNKKDNGDSAAFYLRRF